MDYAFLGKTNLLVSRLCFGTLGMGPLQAKLPLDEGAELLAAAFRAGVNFWDTAELYRNYPYLRLALKKTGAQPVIATKTYAHDTGGAKAALEKARRDLDLDVIPVFLLHEQESALTMEGHREALDYLCEARERGFIKAVGISCHTIAAVKAALRFPEVEVIHPIINQRSIGIKDGTVDEMLSAIRLAFDKGLGIYGMKVLGGGHLSGNVEQALDFAKNLGCLDSVAVGMVNRDELEINLSYMEGITPPADVLDRVAAKKRRLKIEDWCSGCGRCVSACPQEALFLEESGQKRSAAARMERCIFCAYCGAACPEMCIKVI